MKCSLLSLVLLALVFTGCATEMANPSTLQPATALPTANPTQIAAFCASASLGARDWQAAIAALEALNRIGQTCPGTEARPAQQLANAYFGYGTALEADGELTEAITAYETALGYAPTMIDVQRRLERLQGERTAAEECSASLTNDQSQLAAYQPTTIAAAELTPSGFTVAGEPFPVYGANYYPRDTPFEYFLAQTELEAVRQELALMREAGLNTLRVYLIYDTLFTCMEGTVRPEAAAFSRLDQLIAAAAGSGFRLILVLNHTLDIAQPPVTMAQSFSAKTAFIVARYSAEPAILAWDLRDSGDRDYVNSVHTRQEVLAWLAQTAALVRSLDATHPITAGWYSAAEDTAPLVDFVSFQSFGEYEALRQKIASLRASVNRPILLAAVGYSTFQMDETSQRNLLYQTFEEVRHNDLMGWIVYMAFDYPRTVTCMPPDCPGSGQPINHFGLWNTSYFPKLAVDAVRVVTGVTDP